jgi:hypothetical protein
MGGSLPALKTAKGPGHSAYATRPRRRGDRVTSFLPHCATRARSVSGRYQPQARARDWLVKQVKQESGEVAEDKGPYTVQHGGVAVIV